MRATHKALRILFVEQGVGFGGSLVVVAHLVKCLPKAQFVPVVVGEMPEEMLRYQIGDHAALEIVRHPLNYTHRAKVARLLKKAKSRTVFRAGMYAFTLLATCANLFYAFRLCSTIVRHRIDIVHINQPDNTEAILAAAALGRKILIQSHGTGHIGLTHRLTLRTVDHFVAISTHVRKFLLASGITEDRISLIPNPTIIKRLPARTVDGVRREYGITAGQKIFGIFGRVVAWKGHREFLAAAIIALAKCPEARAFIVGDASDGPDGFVESLRHQARESGFAERIIFTGHVLEVERLYSVMDVVVHASIEPEPFGLVITEAMAHGIPVIASPSGATTEIITPGHDGLLVDPRRPTELADTILRLLANDALRRAMGARAKDTVQRKYDGQLYAQRMGAVYRHVAGLPASDDKRSAPSTDVDERASADQVDRSAWKAKREK